MTFEFFSFSSKPIDVVVSRPKCFCFYKYFYKYCEKIIHFKTRVAGSSFNKYSNKYSTNVIFYDLKWFLALKRMKLPLKLATEKNWVSSFAIKPGFYHDPFLRWTIYQGSSYRHMKPKWFLKGIISVGVPHHSHLQISHRPQTVQRFIGMFVVHDRDVLVYRDEVFQRIAPEEFSRSFGCQSVGHGPVGEVHLKNFLATLDKGLVIIALLLPTEVPWKGSCR